MKIWIDLANSPQVLFFRPIVAHLKHLGHDILITSRHYAQTIELADEFALAHVPVGKHGGRNIGKALSSNWHRSKELRAFASGRGIELALSHNSYSQILAAWRMGIPAVTTTDYEHNPLNHFAFRLATRVIVPSSFPEDKLRWFGARKKSVVRYSGIKEQVYLDDFKPDEGFADRIGLPKGKVITVLRPPADWTPYHLKKNKLMDRLIGYLAADANTFVVFLPRIPDQRGMLGSWDRKNYWIPPHAVDGPNLICAADLVISAGGTMSREAGVLGTPSYTVFAGKLAGVDKYLLDRERMKVIQCVADFPPLKRVGERRNKLQGENVVAQIVRAMVELPEERLRSS
jgi:predicted glycosyltransferase